jgi:hypothetical protein
VSNDETGYRSIHKFSTYDRSVPKDNVTCDIEDLDPETTEVEFTIQYSLMSNTYHFFLSMFVMEGGCYYLFVCCFYLLLFLLLISFLNNDQNIKKR